jgi:uncharacterized damage-inducible protein DinB
MTQGLNSVCCVEGGSLDNQLIESWAIHNRINLYLLEAIPEAALGGLSASKGRNVGEQFAHLHNVRLMWLKSAALELLEGLTKIEKEQPMDKRLLKKSLQDSGKAIEALLQKGIDANGKIKGFKPHVTAFLCYLISHESHHRGQIALTVKQCGHKLDQKTAYGIWEWGVR